MTTATLATLSAGRDADLPGSCHHEAGGSKAPNRRWGVVLAGGDGKRLLPLTRGIAGDERPKQFCAVLGDRTLLHQTRARIEGLIPPHRTWVVVNRRHERFYAGALSAEAGFASWLIQPQNRGTAPAILYSLIRLAQLDPEAVVAFFPSDHHFEDEEGFAASVESAFEAAESPLRPVVLIGIAPDSPVAEYGWIEPGEQLAIGSGSLLRVKRFWEKPPLQFAAEMMAHGCLWNSFVMVGSVDSFLRLFRSTRPHLVQSFDTLRTIAGTPQEKTALYEVYSCIPSINFSNDVLAMCQSGLAVLAAGNLGWSDLGAPERVLSVLRRKGVRSNWEIGQAADQDVAS